jgi:hypothetical protein
MPLFNRACKLIIGSETKTQLEFNQDFKIVFSIQKNVNSTSKTNKVSIYNISKTHRDQIFDLVKTNKSGLASEVGLWLYAGYLETTGAELIYSGNIAKVLNKFDIPDITTEFTCADSSTNFKTIFFEMGYDGGVSTKDIYKQIAEKSGLKIDESSVYPPATSFTGGYSFIGNAKDALDSLTKQTGAAWHINNGKIKIAPKNSRTNESAIVLNSQSGLIGIPERIDDEGYNSDDTSKLNGWRVKSLLQAGLTPHRSVELQTSEIKGTFIVQAVTHAGDTTSGDWTSTCELVEVTK